jgi:hypothetical protein
MQSDSNEVTQNTPLNQDTNSSHLNSHHGLDRADGQPTRQLRASQERAENSRSTSVTSSSTSTSRGSDDSFERSIRGLRGNSPVDRIDEHEKASSYSPSRRNRGPAFAVIQRGRNATIGQVALADFPNGSLFTIHDYSLRSLINCRGFDSCSISSITIVAIGCILSVPSFSPVGHYTARMEDCLFPLLPRT